MKLKTLFNEFELDWIEAPLRKEEFPFQHLQNKTFVIAGNSDISEAFIYSLLYAIDNGTIQAEVFWCPMTDKKNYKIKKEILSHNKFHISNLADISYADFMVYTGLCGQDISEETDIIQEILHQAHKVYQSAASIKPHRFLLLSDYRAMYRTNNAIYVSEYEHSLDSYSNADALPRMLFQLLESLCMDYSKQYGFSCNILRFPIIFGACICKQDHFINSLASRISAGKEITLFHTGSSYSYIYISDALTAIWHVLALCPANTVFHTSGKETPITLEDIFSIVYKNFPDSARITFKDEKNSTADFGLSMNDDKLRMYGWSPEVPFEDGLIMLIKSIQNPEQTFVFNQTYQGKLDIVHKILLAHLLEVDRICKKHHIKYFLAGGTLLGAVRHHGFIPWDDDADIMMLRKDFDKFSKIVQKELPNNLFFQSNKTEDLNHAVFCKIRINDTVFATQHTARFPQMHNGIFADVLSHDATADHRLSQKLHIFATRGVRSLVFNKWAHSSVRIKNKPTIVVKLLNHTKDLLPMSLLEWMQEKLLTLFSTKKAPRYLYDGMGRNIGRGSFPSSWLDDVIETDFEGYQLPIPKEYDKYLTWLYGDYSQMIPVSKRRISHSIVWIDLGEYENFTLK